MYCHVACTHCRYRAMAPPRDCHGRPKVNHYVLITPVISLSTMQCSLHCIHTVVFDVIVDESQFSSVIYVCGICSNESMVSFDGVYIFNHKLLMCMDDQLLSFPASVKCSGSVIMTTCYLGQRFNMVY